MRAAYCASWVPQFESKRRVRTSEGLRISNVNLPTVQEWMALFAARFNIFTAAKFVCIIALVLQVRCAKMFDFIDLEIEHNQIRFPKLSDPRGDSGWAHRDSVSSRWWWRLICLFLASVDTCPRGAVAACFLQRWSRCSFVAVSLAVLKDRCTCSFLATLEIS